MEMETQRLLTKAVEFLNRHEYAKAVETLDRVVHARNTSPATVAQARNHRGFALFCLGDMEGAEADWRAVEAMPEAGPEHQQAARGALRRLQASNLLRQGDAALQTGDREAALCVYGRLLEETQWHDFDRLMAAQAVEGIEEAPADLRQKAAGLLSEVLHRGDTSRSGRAGLSSSRAEPVDRAEPRGACSRFVLAVVGYIVESVVAGTLMAASFALIFFVLGIIFALLARDWSFMLMLPLFGILIGFLLGCGNVFIGRVTRPTA